VIVSLPGAWTTAPPLSGRFALVSSNREGSLIRKVTRPIAESLGNMLTRL